MLKIYEWEDRRSAMKYLDRLMVVLAPWTEAGSRDFRIIEADRIRFLDGSYGATASATSTAGQWWLPVADHEALSVTDGPAEA